MKKIIIPLCLGWICLTVNGQRSNRFMLPDRLFSEGKELFELGNYAGTIDKLGTYKQISADAALIQEADFLIACAVFRQGTPQVELVLKNFMDTYPDTHHADEVHFMVGSVHFDKEEYEKAVFWLRESEIDMLSPEQQEEYSFRLAYSLLQVGDYDTARSYFTRISQIGSTYREAAAYYVAYINYATTKYDEALAEFTRLKDFAAYREQSHYYITQIHFIRNRYDRVIAEGESLISLNADSEYNTELYRMLGNSYYNLGDWDKALDRLSKYVSLTGLPLRGDLYILGVCYYNKGNYSSAINSFGRVTTANDALSQNAGLFLGQSYLKQGDKNNARMAFESAATASFDVQVKETAMYNYALLIHEINFTGFGESVAIFENFLNDFPNSRYADKVNDYLVEVYMATKNYQTALASIERINRPSTKILGAQQNILFQLGTQAFTNMKLDEATGLFSRAINLGSYNEEARNDAYYWRGESYYRQEKYQQAITDFRTYLNNTRQHSGDMYALAHYNLGYSYFKLNNYNEALNRFRQYASLEKNQKAPALADSYNRIGDCLFYNRRFSEAESNYTKAAGILPSAGDYALYQKGYVMGLQKDYQGKIQAMDQLIREFPESQYVDDALFEKGRSYVLLEENRAAAETFETLTGRFPQSSLARKAGIQLGLIYFNDNQSQKAVEAYKMVIKNYPGSDEAKVALQDLRSVYVDLNDVGAYANYVNSLEGSAGIGITEQDSLTYIAAERLFMRGEMDEARRSFTVYLQNYPLGAFSSNANYYLGSISFNNKEYTDAKTYFDRVIGSNDMKFMEDAVARKAEIDYMDKNYAAGLESFKRLQLIAENPSNREAARLGIMRCAHYTNQVQDALIAANELLKDSKISPEIATEARYVRGKSSLSSGQKETAMADLKELSKDTRTAYGAEAKYLLVQLYYDNKDDANAIKILEDYAKNGTPHQYWLARSFILWADIYIRQGDEVQARVYLNSLRNNYKGDDEIAGMIEDRLGKLKN